VVPYGLSRAKVSVRAARWSSRAFTVRCHRPTLPGAWWPRCRRPNPAPTDSVRVASCSIWHSLRGVAVAVAMLAVVIGICAALIHVDGGLIGHGLAAIGFI
jgi:hypothetical protein